MVRVNSGGIMNKVGWIIFGVATVLLLGGLIAWNYIANPPIDVSNVNQNEVISASEQSGGIADHVKGSDAKKIIFVEYGDYQCPGCGSAYSYVNQVVDEYKDSVTFIFRNFPLTTIHPNARAAAAVAEAAGLQGKYWEMHDLIYKGQQDWSNADASKRVDLFQQYAEQLKLDINKFKTDLASSEVNKKIRYDQAIGKKAEVSETPTFFLNGEKLDAETAEGIVKGDLTKFKAKLDELIKQQK